MEGGEAARPTGARSRTMCFVPGMLTSEFFCRHPLACSIDLIGCELAWGHCRGVIVETEGYTALGDEACHTFLRRGAQRFVDGNPPGTAYIYLNYGIHWLLNVLVKGGGMEGFVLVRAVEPTAGLEIMRERRKLPEARQLCSGPGKLTQAFGIPATFHGFSLCHDPRKAFHAGTAERMSGEIVCDARIGISRAAELPWRFLEAGSAYVSRKPTAAATGAMTRRAAREQFALGDAQEYCQSDESTP